MCELLSVVGVPLVRVMHKNLVVPSVNEGFPDTRGSVGGIRRAGRDYGGDVGPGCAAVSACVDLESIRKLTRHR